jgi:hypothetical protein
MYIVPGMKLIPQTMTMSCWYASMQMLIKWKEEQKQVSYAGLISPEFDTQCAAIRDANTGITNPQIVKIAKSVGLKAVPPVSPSPEAIEGWLKAYGPLWVNGKSHIVVIAGIMTLPLLDTMLLVYDPSPVNVGRVEWRSMSDWYAMGSTVSSRDTGKDVEAVFLYVPDDL